MSNEINKLAETIKRLSKTDYYSVRIDSEIQPGIFNSKIGGIPYWTPDRIYPINDNNKKLFLLAQINFDEEKVDSPLPQKGMLQFFINDDDLMGLNCDDQIKQNNFRVIYHEIIDYNITKESIEKLEIPNSKNAQCYPVYGEYKISLTKNIDYVNFEDFHFNKFFKLAYKEVYNKDLKDDDYYHKILNEEDIKILNKEIKPKKINHKILGYSYFTQEDPRYVKKYADYNILLLQIDSEGKYVMWGDAGIGNFFISEKSLIEKDFSNVLYNWDCC